MIPAVEFETLTKDFPVGVRGRRLRALDAVSFDIAPGETVALLGPNGSGKSTALKVMLGLTWPTAGRCRIFGRDANDANARRDVGFMPDAPYFPRLLTGREVVRFHGELAGLTRQESDARAGEGLADVGLAAAANRRVGSYSKGMLQRLGLAQALVHRPRLLVMDEPTAGVDAEGVELILDTIRRLKSESVTIVLTSHVRDHVLEVCDRAVTLEGGRLVADDLLEAREESCWLISGPPLAPDEKCDAQHWLASRGRELRRVIERRRLPVAERKNS